MSAYVQVPVPEQHVPKVYELLARLDRGDATQSEDQAQVSDVELAPVPELDEVLVKRMYDESYDRHKQLWSCWPHVPASGSTRTSWWTPSS